MPIRTPRGRRAVYRPFGNMIMWTPWHALGSLVVVLGALWIFFWLLPDKPSSSVAPPTSTSIRPTELPKFGAPSDAREVAEAWARAWVNPLSKPSREDWKNDLRTYSTKELINSLDTVDLNRVPREVRGTIMPKSSFSVIKVQVEFATERGPVRLELVNRPPEPYMSDVWLVQSYIWTG